ncbi:phosphotransferase enzyme family protein [Coccidioides immitis RS]|uniref:Altered inheritance of mitochondria protein 9, mitochondrial n=1 Tax=Coccidioides immitis (strain RS) TaxID=246410 RepID=A0A0E1RXC0_COCIM|nr:phosphotransferase enzyme family protein [Coccidioides immitis RS]EAS33804.1 phosphotransferase enzyme family protein [Coccidioides immitis RS]
MRIPLWSWAQTANWFELSKPAISTGLWIGLRHHALLQVDKACAPVWGGRPGRDLRPLKQNCSANLERIESNNHFFCYTSGRWLYNEPLQLKKRYVRFNVPALQQIAGRIASSRCVEMTKIPEGLYNKVFSLRMENGREILARIPNPNAGHPQRVVASEVATLDFLRNVLDIPVPRVLSWSSPSQPNPVGAEYIFMERVKGRQLSEVWGAMSEAQHFGLVKSLVEIEQKLVDVKFALHGSLYYKSTCYRGRNVVDPTEPTNEVTSDFVIGPTTQRSFWEDEKGELDIDRGPWGTAQEYLSSVANREIAVIQNLGPSRSSNTSVVLGKTQQGRDEHVHLLEQFLRVLPHILPPQETLRPALLHHDLHSDNIFVDSSDPTKISSIIDWQAVYTAPLFLQAKFPSIFDCDDPYPWGAVQPKLPKDFDTLSQSEKELAEDTLVRLRLKKFYELASRKFNQPLVMAMDAMRNDDDPTTFIFHIVGQSSQDGPVPLKELLIQIYEKWDQIMERRGLATPCPISFSKDEIDKSRQQVKEWADAYGEFESLRTDIVGKDGWVSHEEYGEAMRRWDNNRATLEILQERLDKLLLQ